MPGLLKSYNQHKNISGITRQSYKSNPPVNDLPEVCPRCEERDKKFYTHIVDGKRYYNENCADCYTYLWRIEWRKRERVRNPEREYLRLRHTQLKVKYGLSLDDYRSMLKAQGGGCAICGVERSGYSSKRTEDYVIDMPVDHCHETGLNRGVLCHKCNKLIGFAEDNPKVLLKAIKYLQEWQIKHSQLQTKV